jgi:hypothetical protein
MAFETSHAQVLAATHQEYIRGIADGYTEDNVGFHLLEKKGRVRRNVGGDYAEWRVRKQTNSTVSDYGGGHEELVFTRENYYDIAKLNYKGYKGTYELPWWDIVSNKGDEAVFNLQREELEWLRSDIMEKMNDGFWDDGTADNANGFEGIQAFVKQTGTYANISQTNTYWQGQTVAGASGPNSSFATDAIERMATAFVNANRGGGRKGRMGKVDCWTTDRATWVVVHSAIQTNERFGYGTDKSTANAGFENILVLGRPMYWDDSHPANTMYGLNFSTMELVCATKDMLVPDSKLLMSPKVYVGTAVCKALIRCNSPRYNVSITATNT